MHPSLRLTILICDEEQGTVVQDKFLGLFSQVSLLVFCTALWILITSEIIKKLGCIMWSQSSRSNRSQQNDY